MKMTQEDVYVLTTIIGFISEERKWFKNPEEEIVNLLTPQLIIEIDLNKISDEYFKAAENYFFEVNMIYPTKKETFSVMIKWLMDCIIKDCSSYIFRKGMFTIQFKHEWDFFGEPITIRISYLVEKDLKFYNI